MCCPLVFEFSVGIGGFVIGLGQISFFFSHNLYGMPELAPHTDIFLRATLLSNYLLQEVYAKEHLKLSLRKFYRR